MKSTAATLSVPWARAATAWLPPMQYTSSMSSRYAAASTLSSIPRFAAPRSTSGGGVARQMRPTPATCAGTASMISVDG